MHKHWAGVEQLGQDLIQARTLSGARAVELFDGTAATPNVLKNATRCFPCETKPLRQTRKSETRLV
ncbi:hypothetical protein BANT918_02813 [Brevibacterium antiquum CNRZ 918]|uniref:Uncharacterized protein n=1 Tax=Brevibacterium antiquum CNRZ 918 TaxID=1255637 RepID=A0A2H1KTT1_9MICO|nr:hypothetical protein BANT918_02813 [Brevibacterium antiquum CNRZ 918]